MFSQWHREQRKKPLINRTVTERRNSAAWKGVGVGDTVDKELDSSQCPEGFPVSGSHGVGESFKTPTVLTGPPQPGSQQMT